MMLDATKAEQQRALLEAELEVVGLRLNKKPPNVSLFHFTYQQIERKRKKQKNRIILKWDFYYIKDLFQSQTNRRTCFYRHCALDSS